ncbi:MAG: trypsin-like peptidase domain-containing protein [Planctomycetia bacterium]|jgi:S1-C subfamily serine protease
MHTKTPTFCFTLLILVVGSSWVSISEARSRSSSRKTEGDLLSAVQEKLVGVIEKNEPSVVAVVRTRRTDEQAPTIWPTRPSPFGQANEPNQPGWGQKSSARDPIAAGDYATGVVLEKGLILTTYHAVLGADGRFDKNEYHVITHDRKTHRATLRAADPRSDLAMLGVEAENLTPITLGDASHLKKGTFTVAMGNPRAIAAGDGPTAVWAMVGNLSQKAPLNRFASAEQQGKWTLHHFGTLIRTDARLAASSTGGPLLDLQGRMIGMTTSLGDVPGLESRASYAIPVDETFRKVVKQLSQGREVEYGYLGIEPEDLTAREQEQGMQGVRVHRVYTGPGNPARAADIRRHDRITAIAGQLIHSSDELILTIGSLPVDQRVAVDLVRDGRRERVRVKLGKYPVRGERWITVQPDPWRGIRIDYPTVLVDYQSEASSVGVDQAVAIVEVARDTAAWAAGLRPGMLVTHLNNHPTGTPEAFRKRAVKISGPARLKTLSEGQVILP